MAEHLFASQDNAQCPLFYTLKDRVASHSRLRVSTDSVDISSPSQSEGQGTENDTGNSAVGREILAGGYHTYAVCGHGGGGGCPLGHCAVRLDT